jgi:hypothetical protein
VNPTTTINYTARISEDTKISATWALSELSDKIEEEKKFKKTA